MKKCRDLFSRPFFSVQAKQGKESAPSVKTFDGKKVEKRQQKVEGEKQHPAPCKMQTKACPRKKAGAKARRRPCQKDPQFLFVGKVGVLCFDPCTQKGKADALYAASKREEGDQMARFVDCHGDQKQKHLFLFAFCHQKEEGDQSGKLCGK